MQIDAQTFLPIAERANALAFVDIEASNLKADFGTVVVVSIKPYGKEPVTFSTGPGRDKGLLQDVQKEMSKYPVWVTFYGKMFDIPFLNSRALVNGLPPLPKYHHIDLYWVIKLQTALSRRNQAHLLEWLEAPSKKMSVSPNVWAELPVRKDALPKLVERCESDVIGLEAMYEKTKHLIREITR
jgi:hypothetical protein